MPVRPYRGKWQADFTDQFGVRKRPSFDTKREAKDYLTKVEGEIRARTYRPEAAKTTYGEIATIFLIDSESRVKNKEISDRTHDNYRSIVERYILGTGDLRTVHSMDKYPVFFDHPIGKFLVGDITAAHITRFRSSLSDRGLKAVTVRNIVSLASSILSYAVDNNYIAMSPAPKLKRLRNREEDDEEVIIPEKAVIGALCNAARPADRLILQMAALTGLRTSEQRALAWKAIDFDEKLVRVVRAVGNKGKIGPVKTKFAKRMVPLSDALITMLREHRASSRFSGEDDLVFANRKGNPQSHSNWVKRVYDRTWTKASKAWNGPGELERAKWHSLRHFAISTWIEKDVPIKQIQKWAGHSTAGMTLDVYGHLFKSANHRHIVDDIASEIFSKLE